LAGLFFDVNHSARGSVALL